MSPIPTMQSFNDSEEKTHDVGRNTQNPTQKGSRSDSREKENCRYLTRLQPGHLFKASERRHIDEKSRAKLGLEKTLNAGKEGVIIKTASCSKMQISKAIKSSNASKNECATSNEIPAGESRNKGGICPKCEDVFEDPHSFTLHIKKHNTDDTTCGICSKKLSSASSLDRHLLTHTGEKPFKCKYCQQSFTTNGNMHRHVNIHELKGDVKVPVDSKRLKSAVKKEESRIQDDGSREAKSNGDSPECTKSRTQDSPEKACEPQREIETSNTTESDPTVGEEYHDFSYIPFSSNKFPLVAKKECEENSVPNNSQSGYKCQICEKVFPCLSALTKHKAFHESARETICNDCNCHFESPEHLEKHILRYHQQLGRGDTVNVTFMAALGLYHKAIESQKEVLHTCKKMDVDETENRIVAADSKTTKSQRENIEKLEKKVVLKDFFSPKRIMNLKGNGMHTNSRESEEDAHMVRQKVILEPVEELSMKPYQNNQTTSLTVRQKDGQKYQENVFQCVGKTLNYNKVGEINCTTVKQEVNVQNCHKESSNDFADIPSILSNLAATPGTSERNTNSLEIKHAESNSETESYIIPDYSKGAKKKKSRKVSYSQSKGLYYCKLCIYKSADKSSIIRHMVTHNKERPFKCTICHFTFTTKSNGERHAKSKHNLPKHDRATAIGYNCNISNSDSKDNVCKYCNLKFHNKRGLQHHLRSTTKSCSEKPYICRKCGQGCSTKNNCFRHIHNKHKKFINNVIKENPKAKIVDFVIVNRDKKVSDMKASNKKARGKKAEQTSASDAEAGRSAYESSNCNTFSSEASSPKSHKNLEQHQSFNEVDRKTAAESLVSLSEGLVIQAESFVSFLVIQEKEMPLDLSIRALDLSDKKSDLYSQSHGTRYATGESCSSFAGSFNVASSRNQQSDIYPICSTPLNLTCKQNSSSDIPPMSTIENTITPISQSFVSDFTSEQAAIDGNSSSVSPQHKAATLKSIKCDYCDKYFGNKSNKQRHVRNFHHKDAKPQRNSVFVPYSHDRNVPKQGMSTLSHKTKKALLTKFLAPSVVNSRHHNKDIEDKHPIGNLVIKEESESPMEEGLNSDFENTDLASVSSVINTANSPTFTQYLTEDMNNNTFAQNSEDQSNNDNEFSKKKNCKRKFQEEDGGLVCPECDKRFEWGSSLRRHSVTHTGEKPYQCPSCKRYFNTNSNMRRHCRKKQKNGCYLHPLSTSQSSSHHSSLIHVMESASGDKSHNNERTLALTEACYSPVVQREYPKKNKSPSEPETAETYQAAIPSTSRLSMGTTQTLECSVCNTTYKTEHDLSNHMKELHRLEYERMHGKKVHQPDIVSLWKKNGCAKLKR